MAIFNESCHKRLTKISYRINEEFVAMIWSPSFRFSPSKVETVISLSCTSSSFSFGLPSDTTLLLASCSTMRCRIRLSGVIPVKLLTKALNSSSDMFFGKPRLKWEGLPYVTFKNTGSLSRPVETLVPWT